MNMHKYNSDSDDSSFSSTDLKPVVTPVIAKSGGKVPIAYQSSENLIDDAEEDSHSKVSNIGAFEHKQSISYSHKMPTMTKLNSASFSEKKSHIEKASAGEKAMDDDSIDLSSDDSMDGKKMGNSSVSLLSEDGFAELTTFDERPYQLVKVTKDNKFELCEDGVNLLKTVKGKLGIVALAGLYRTGKSFALNLLIDKIGKGFDVASTVKSCTQGVWIWGKPVYMEDIDMTIILLDTEGSGSVERNQTHDAKIFALVVLICSYFIYNSVGVIDEGAIASLSLAAQLSNNIALKVRKGSSKDEKISEFSPKFLWLLRDFMLELKDTNGRPINSNQYLEDCLRNQSKDSSNGEVNKKVREALVKFFRQRECMTLIRPVEEEDDLRILNKLKIDQLRPEFQKQAVILKKKVYEECPIKQINGKNLDGKILAKLLSQYVAAINDGAVPNITTAWENVLEEELESGFEKAKKHYTKRMSELQKPNYLPKETNDLTTEFHAIRKETEQIFDEGLVYLDKTSVRENPQVKSYAYQLISLFTEKENSLYKMNIIASEKTCNEIAKELFLEIEKKLGGGIYDDENLETVDIDFKNFLQKYEERGIGPKKCQVLNKTLQKNFKKFFDILLGTQKVKHEGKEREHLRNITELKEKLGDIANDNQLHEEIEHTQKGRLENLILQLEQHKRSEEALQKKVEDLKQELKEEKRKEIYAKNNVEAIDHEDDEKPKENGMSDNRASSTQQNNGNRMQQDSSMSAAKKNKKKKKKKNGKDDDDTAACKCNIF